MDFVVPEDREKHLTVWQRALEASATCGMSSYNAYLAGGIGRCTKAWHKIYDHTGQHVWTYAWYKVSMLDQEDVCASQ